MSSASALPPASLVPTLFLVRHARAGGPRPGERDVDRVLDDVGAADARRIAGAIRQRGWSLGTVFCSPARRCRQTADLLLQPNPRVALDIDAALYDGTVDAYQARIEQALPGAPVTLIGHNPLIEQAAFACLGAVACTKALPAGFLPCTVVAIALGADGLGRLVAVLTP